MANYKPILETYYHLKEVPMLTNENWSQLNVDCRCAFAAAQAKKEKAERMLARLTRQIFPEPSPEFATFGQYLYTHLPNDPEGQAYYWATIRKEQTKYAETGSAGVDER
jgi:hypothetical protein